MLKSIAAAAALAVPHQRVPRGGVVQMVKRWMTRDRQRRALGDLDAHLLRDIGLTADRAQHEGDKWFWMP